MDANLLYFVQGDCGNSNQIKLTEMCESNEKRQATNWVSKERSSFFPESRVRGNCSLKLEDDNVIIFGYRQEESKK